MAKEAQKEVQGKEVQEMDLSAYMVSALSTEGETTKAWRPEDLFGQPIKIGDVIIARLPKKFMDTYVSKDKLQRPVAEYQMIANDRQYGFSIGTLGGNQIDVGLKIGVKFPIKK